MLEIAPVPSAGLTADDGTIIGPFPVIWKLTAFHSACPESVVSAVL